MATEAILTFRQAARRLGLSIPTLRRWQRQGLLPEAYRGEEHQGVWVLKEDDLPAVAERNGWAGRSVGIGDSEQPSLSESVKRVSEQPPSPGSAIFSYYHRFLPADHSDPGDSGE